ncbi:MAG: efflux RND transporter periplasmic adaptor subunit [Opitutaceae bacterium]|jgi:membrane fusion protein (multidrug efflux system)|nr:efflux RND transporter periplasmic adaptor subunit [Opitutaceae bacterium]
MKIRFLLVALVVVALFGSIFGYKAYTIKAARAAAAGRRPPPVVVAALAPSKETWANTLDAVASLQSYQGIVVRSEIEGRIVRIGFESGAKVKEGDVLVELDLSTETAQLAGLEAQAKLAAVNLNRAHELRTQTSNTQADVDAAEAAAAQSQAALAVLQATLAKKRIIAPFSGRLGLREVNLGQFLNKGDAIVSLEAVDPIYADFGLPQQDIPLLSAGLAVHLAVDAFAPRRFEGLVEATSARVNDETRNVRVRAVFPNRNEELRPGMFGRVDVVLPGQREVLVLPSSAITYSPYGDSVYVVVTETTPAGPQSVARQRFVQAGPRRGDQVSILKGLQPGETVVVAGQMKLRNGSPVKVDNSILPDNNPAPKPAES